MFGHGREEQALNGGYLVSFVPSSAGSCWTADPIGVIDSGHSGQGGVYAVGAAEAQWACCERTRPTGDWGVDSTEGGIAR